MKKPRKNNLMVKKAFGVSPTVTPIFSNTTHLPLFQDHDNDGVPNWKDCDPFDPNRQGILHDIGGAVKTRTQHEVGDIKEHLIEEIAGEEKREERLEIEAARKKASLAARKKVAEEEEERRARAKFERIKEEAEARREERREERRTVRRTQRVSPFTKTRETTKQRPSYSSGFMGYKKYGR